MNRADADALGVLPRALAIVLSCAVVLSLGACRESNATAAVSVPLSASTQSTNANTHKTHVSWKLPKELREISGLAFDRDASLKGSHAERIYAVADERAVVVGVHAVTGNIETVFSLGKPALTGDFEGIAIAAGGLYLITSDGQLLRTVGASDGGYAAFEQFDLGTSDICEIEGLVDAPAAVDAVVDTLWIACKRLMNTDKRDVLRLYAWSIPEERILSSRTLELDKQALLDVAGVKGFSPSGLAFLQLEDTPHLMVIASAQRAYGLWRWQQVPALVHAGRLPSRHQQAEGLEIGPEQQLYIADEGRNKGDKKSHKNHKKRGRLRAYVPIQMSAMPSSELTSDTTVEMPF